MLKPMTCCGSMSGHTLTCYLVGGRVRKVRTTYIVPTMARRIVAYMRQTGLTNVRRRDLMSDLSISACHASQALAHAVQQGSIVRRGIRRGARYHIPGY